MLPNSPCICVGFIHLEYVLGLGLFCLEPSTLIDLVEWGECGCIDYVEGKKGV